MSENPNTNYIPPIARVAADVICVLKTDDDLKLLLIERGNEPFKGNYAIPGGFVEENEDVKDAAIRELKEETNVDLNISDIKLLGVYGKPFRDPRGRTISVVYSFVTSNPNFFSEVKAQDDAKNYDFISASALPKLAFDHNDIIVDLLKDLKDSNLLDK